MDITRLRLRSLLPVTLTILALAGAWAAAAGQSLSFTTLRSVKVDPAGGAGTVEACEFSPDGSLFAAGNARGEARIYETSTGRVVRTLRHAPSPDHSLGPLT